MKSEFEYANDRAGYAGGAPIVASASASERAAFITKTYLHLFGAILLFAVLEVFWFTTPVPGMMFSALSGGRFMWLLFMGGFVGVSMLADKWALSSVSKGKQYAVFITRKDFSFMCSALMFAGFAAMGLVVASVLFGFTLGLMFSYAMVALACGYILYDTSNVMQRYRTNQHVASALALFAAVMLLFWYVLRIFLDRRR
jgi:FtsH-binding integral membrane protein